MLIFETWKIRRIFRDLLIFREKKIELTMSLENEYDLINMVSLGINKQERI